ncbi:MAG: hypothetical protein WC319_06880 [Candidatus Paceibacterota bacterium]|jgi:glycyl-tRNA synthetase (class II)
MDKKYFIIFFILLFIGSLFAIFNNNQSLTKSLTDLNKDKIKTTVQGAIKETSKKAGEVTSAIVEKIEEIAIPTYETIKEKGGEAVSAMIVEPSLGIAKDLVKQVLTSASSTFLTEEDIKDILLDNSNGTCNCK